MMIGDIMERFKPDINVGLTKKQVDSRFRDNLYNVDTTVSTKPTKDIIKDNVFTIFNIVNFFLACMVLTTGSFKNLLFMGGIICNTIISIVQELRSKKVLDKLQVVNESKVCTIRDGKEEKLSINSVVLDDVIKFLEREKRRGRTYHGIIMDPPSYGRGANGEVWDIEKNLNYLIELCMEILSDEPLFFLINSYTTGLSSTSVSNLLTQLLCKKYGGFVMSDEIGIPFEDSDLILPCGSTARWISGDIND